MKKKDKLVKIHAFFDKYPDSGFYLTSYGFWPFKKYLIGDHYGPMGPGRFMTIDEFLRRYSDNI